MAKINDENGANHLNEFELINSQATLSNTNIRKINKELNSFLILLQGVKHHTCPKEDQRFICINSDVFLMSLLTLVVLGFERNFYRNLSNIS